MSGYIHDLLEQLYRPTPFEYAAKITLGFLDKGKGRWTDVLSAWENAFGSARTESNDKIYDIGNSDCSYVEKERLVKLLAEEVHDRFAFGNPNYMYALNYYCNAVGTDPASLSALSATVNKTRNPACHTKDTFNSLIGCYNRLMSGVANPHHEGKIPVKGDCFLKPVFPICSDPFSCHY